MEKPQSVFQAELAIWATIAVSAVGSLINKASGAISTGEFAGYLFLYGLLCIFPYKIGRGSNPTRYVYAVITALSVLFLLGGPDIPTPKLDIILSFLLLPVEIFIIYRLFQRESTPWFVPQR